MFIVTYLAYLSHLLSISRFPSLSFPVTAGRPRSLFLVSLGSIWMDHLSCNNKSAINPWTDSGTKHVKSFDDYDSVV
jgi:hypothetical protein